jgi:hypothetical protein
MTSTHEIDLRHIIRNRRWRFCSEPFRHVTATDVFQSQFYAELEREFQRILDRGFAPAPEEGRLARSESGYDAYAMNFSPRMAGPLRTFFGRAWHDTLAALFGVVATGDVAGGLHHHAVGSAYGKIHNDLNPAWFLDRSPPGGVQVADNRICNYYTGATHAVMAPRRETVRAVAMIYYLNNPRWLRGDGGETGLYRSGSDAVSAPAAAVPPVNNSLLAFECTPFSYHAFVSNVRSPRNSVIIWLHRKLVEAASLWGGSKIVPWPAG